MRRWLAIAAPLLGCATSTPLPERAADAARLIRAAEDRTGNVRLHCTPDDAVVALDGVSIGLCSDFRGQRGVEVKKGARHLAVRKLGYLPYESMVDTDGTRVSLTVSLAPSSLEGGN